VTLYIRLIDQGLSVLVRKDSHITVIRRSLIGKNGGR